MNAIIEIDDEVYKSHKSRVGREERTSKWLSEQLGKDGANRERNNKLACVFCRDAAYFIQRFCNYTKWCTNASQSDLVTLTKVADLLDVDVRQLINKTKGNIADD